MATIQIRIDEKTKKAVQKVLKKADLDLSAVLRYFLRDIAAEKKIPRIITMNGMTWEEEMGIKKASEEARRGINVVGPFEGDQVTEYLNSLKCKSSSKKSTKRATKNSQENFKRRLIAR